MLTIGDVVGKGAAAAVVTALARDTLRAAAMIEVSPAATLRRLNEVLLSYGGGRFCTVAMIRLGHVDGAWHGDVSVGGHPLPILRGADGRLSCIGRPGTLLGVVAEPRVHDVEVHLRAGETLVCYTDGLTEGRRGDEFYGDDRVARSSPATIPQRMPWRGRC